MQRAFVEITNKKKQSAKSLDKKFKPFVLLDFLHHLLFSTYNILYYNIEYSICNVLHPCSQPLAFIITRSKLRLLNNLVSFVC